LNSLRKLKFYIEDFWVDFFKFVKGFRVLVFGTGVDEKDVQVSSSQLYQLMSDKRFSDCLSVNPSDRPSALDVLKR